MESEDKTKLMEEMADMKDPEILAMVGEELTEVRKKVERCELASEEEEIHKKLQRIEFMIGYLNLPTDDG